MALAAGDGQQHQHATTLPCGDDEIIKFVARLEEIWNHIEFKKDEMEIICRENRKLLKPLPKQKTKSEEKDISLEAQQGHKYQMIASSENELAELNLINKALEKAEKAWKKHRTTTEPCHTCEVTPEDSIKNQAKEELGSNSQELVTDDTKVGVISEKELTRAISNVRVSQMKAVYKKAPYKTFDCEQKKTTVSSSDSLYVIPLTVKHLYQQNHSLKRKTVKMKEQSKNAESFLHLWETKMTKTPNGEVKLLTQKYENLSTLLQGLNIPCISDSSSPQEILEAKISLEYILNSVYDLNEQTESLLKKAKPKLTATVNPHMEPVPQTVPREIWLPPHLLYSPFYQHLKETSLRLHYSSLEELNDYWDQQHNLQESLLSHYLLKNVFFYLFPLLKSQHLQQREKIFLYRVLQGFLHSHGKHFPTLINS
ncbi:unnamed protein product [Acanthosepion pharaonis]|uniref:Uncharacterized protein n=1 Tax=Acanthosepion pharaonis TaxID=158019 RepID=A0A812E730_ACAPH|nr:unnamed protein product [Sepia pharaonis]